MWKHKKAVRVTIHDQFRSIYGDFLYIFLFAGRSGDEFNT